MQDLETFRKAKVFNSIQVDEVLGFLSMTTGVKTLRQMLKSTNVQ